MKLSSAHQVVGSHVVQRANVGVVELCDGPRLALKRSENCSLDTFTATKREARVLRLPHLAHSARADPREQLIRTEVLAG